MSSSTEHDAPDVDAALRSWAAEQRIDAAPPAIPVDRFADPTRAHGRWPVVAAACVLVVALGLAIAAITGRTRGSTTGDSSSGLAGLTVRDGDVVQGNGLVVAAPGVQPLFCSGAVILQSRPLSGAPFSCSGGRSTVTVRGLDLRSLSDRIVKDGVVYGKAHLTGIYRHGTLTVTKQGRYVAARVGSSPLSPPGCRPVQLSALPASIRERFVTGAAADPVATYQRSHHEVIDFAVTMSKPAGAGSSGRTALAYVLTTGDPAAARSALSSAYGAALCVGRSTYTTQEIGTARRLFRLDTALTREAGATSSSYRIGPRGQEQIEITLAFMTPELARLAAQQPSGLVKFVLWLTPLGR